MWKETVTKYRHNKEGLVTSKTEVIKQYTGAHALAALVVILGPAILLKFATGVFSNPEAAATVKNIITPDLGPLLDIITPGLPDDAGDLADLIKSFLDPFNFFK